MDEYENGGTENCIVAHLHDAFDPQQEMDDHGDMVCMLALEWCKETIREMCGKRADGSAASLERYSGQDQKLRRLNALDQGHDTVSTITTTTTSHKHTTLSADSIAHNTSFRG